MAFRLSWGASLFSEAMASDDERRHGMRCFDMLNVVVPAVWLGVTIGFTDMGTAIHYEARLGVLGGTTRPANKELKLTKPGTIGASQLNSSVRLTSQASRVRADLFS